MEFKDRNAQYPGRVKLTPVSGQNNVYDMTWADGASVAGTPLNKATFDQFRSELTDLMMQNAGAKGEKGDKGDPGVTLDKKTFLVGTNFENGAGWYKLGSVTFGNYFDYHAKILITSTFQNASMPSGLLDIDVRRGDTGWDDIRIRWESSNGKNPNYIGYYLNSDWELVLYGYVSCWWAFYRVDVLSESNRDGYTNLFKPVNSLINYGEVSQTRYSTSTPTLTGHPEPAYCKCYSWAYSGECTADKVVTCTKSTHGLNVVYGAVLVPKSSATSTNDLSGYSNITSGTNRYGVTLSGTTVHISFDDGTFKKGFYCLIYGV